MIRIVDQSIKLIKYHAGINDLFVAGGIYVEFLLCGYRKFEATCVSKACACVHMCGLFRKAMNEVRDKCNFIDIAIFMHVSVPE